MSDVKASDTPLTNCLREYYEGDNIPSSIYAELERLEIELAAACAECERLRQRAESAEADAGLVIDALSKIENPVKWTQKDAAKNGYRVNGGMLVSLMEDPSYYREIARKTLAQIDAARGKV